MATKIVQQRLVNGAFGQTPEAVWLDANDAGARVVLRCKGLVVALNAAIVGTAHAAAET